MSQGGIEQNAPRQTLHQQSRRLPVKSFAEPAAVRFKEGADLSTVEVQRALQKYATEKLADRATLHFAHARWWHKADMLNASANVLLPGHSKPRKPPGRFMGSRPGRWFLGLARLAIVPLSCPENRREVCGHRRASASLRLREHHNRDREQVGDGGEQRR
jgi:hypothetical protein